MLPVMGILKEVGLTNINFGRLVVGDRLFLQKIGIVDDVSHSVPTVHLSPHIGVVRVGVHDVTPFPQHLGWVFQVEDQGPTVVLVVRDVDLSKWTKWNREAVLVDSVELAGRRLGGRSSVVESLLQLAGKRPNDLPAQEVNPKGNMASGPPIGVITGRLCGEHPHHDLVLEHHAKVQFSGC